MSKRQRQLQGRVISNKMDKTAVVQVTRRVKHKTGKYISLQTKYKIHDADNQLNIGDVVIIGEVRPISKNKSWTLVEVVTIAKGAQS